MTPMPSVLRQAVRSRWFAWTIHGFLWVLLYLVISNAGGRAPAFHQSSAVSPPPQSVAPIARLGLLFATDQWPKPAASTNDPSPFFTRYFVPMPSPAPPPPTTRKIEVTYLGFYETAGDAKNAVLKIGDAFVTARLGTLIATNLFVAQATMQTLTLTNLAAQTNLLMLNTNKQIEVPLK
jgi:hypothetical protein